MSFDILDMTPSAMRVCIFKNMINDMQVRKSPNLSYIYMCN